MAFPGTNLIFLDVDGVINRKKDHKLMIKQGTYFVREELVDHIASIIVETDARVVISSTWRYHLEMQEYVTNCIQEALRQRGYSNLGRVEPGEEPIVEKYNDVVISCTPDLSPPNIDSLSDEEKPQDEHWHLTRTDEIILWLKENALFDQEHQLRKGCPEHTRKQASYGDIEASRWILPQQIRVNNFICLDDMNLFYFSCFRFKSKIKEHLVLTKETVGMTRKHVQEAIKILKSEFDMDEWASETLMACNKSNCYHKQQREEKQFQEKMELAKRSSINADLVIKASKSKSEPAPSIKEVPIKPAPPRRCQSLDDDAYDMVL